ncbi:MAG TPA: Tn3 family transposase [Pseudonocardiaceae bacterium]|nr:Tn3 family transposase [Pseudonocardiaceae bacterium]
MSQLNNTPEVHQGKIHTATQLYRAFRELGRVIRIIVLLRYLSEPALRDSIPAAVQQ